MKSGNVISFAYGVYPLARACNRNKKKGKPSGNPYFAINRPRAFGWSPPEPYLQGETNIV